MLCNWLENHLEIHDFRSIYLLRHAIVCVLFRLTAACFYKTLKWRLEETDYFLSNFRRPKEWHKFVNEIYPYENPLFFIEVDRNKIIGV